MAEGRFASLPRSLHAHHTLAGGPAHPGVPSNPLQSSCSSRGLQASLSSSMDLLSSRPGWVGCQHNQNLIYINAFFLFFCLPRVIFLVPESPQRRAAAYHSCPLLPTSQSPFTELCLDAREAGPTSTMTTLRGTPEPITCNRYLGAKHHWSLDTPINPWPLRWSKISLTTVMVIGKHITH